MENVLLTKPDLMRTGKTKLANVVIAQENTIVLLKEVVILTNQRTAILKEQVKMLEGIITMPGQVLE